MRRINRATVEYTALECRMYELFDDLLSTDATIQGATMSMLAKVPDELTWFVDPAFVAHISHGTVKWDSETLTAVRQPVTESEALS